MLLKIWIGSQTGECMNIKLLPALLPKNECNQTYIILTKDNSW